MYKIMIVEDDEIISNSIAGYLKKWQYATHEVVDFQNVVKEFVEQSPDLVLMDINLPYFDGYYFCEEIRKLSKVPIIFISSANDDMNIVMAMNIGADDFIEKPFKLVVLKAKIEALLRRVYNFSGSSNLVVYKDIIFDMSRDEVKFQDNIIELTKNESKILTVLLENREKILKLSCEESSAISYDNFNKMNRGKQEEYIKGKKVIYIYHDSIDAIGDKGKTESNTFNACKDAVEDIVGLSKLLSSLGVVNVYITSDHGFLYEKKEVEETKKKLEERKVIERAKGIVMAKYTLSEEEAYKKMRDLSMQKRISMFKLAEIIIMTGGLE